MFIDAPRAGLRALGALGATLAVIATMLPWYTFDVSFATKGIAHTFAVPITLWGLTTVAPVVIVVAAVVALLCLTFVDSPVAGFVEGVIGVGIIAYGIFRCVDVPALGVNPVGSGTAESATVIESGPIFLLAAGLILLVSSVADLLLPAGADADDARTAADGRGDGVRFQRGEGRRVRVR
jgi:hypothetical protein